MTGNSVAALSRLHDVKKEHFDRAAIFGLQDVADMEINLATESGHDRRNWSP